MRRTLPLLPASEDDDALTMATSFELYWFVSSAQSKGGKEGRARVE